MTTREVRKRLLAALELLDEVEAARGSEGREVVDEVGRLLTLAGTAGQTLRFVLSEARDTQTGHRVRLPDARIQQPGRGFVVVPRWARRERK